MRKESSEIGVGLRVVQILLPLEWGGGNDAASHAEDDRDAPSSAMASTGEKDHRKRKWYSLYDKVYARKNLETAWEKVRSNHGSSGCDGQTLDHFEEHLTTNLASLHEELREKRYRPRPVRRVYIPKSGGGKRPLGIPTVRDRIVQQAALQILGPIFEQKFSTRSHGFRPERGCQTALAVIDQALCHDYEWVVDADIQRFFDTVDHELLLDAVNEEISDGSVLRLLRMFLESGALLGHGEFESTIDEGFDFLGYRYFRDSQGRLQKVVSRKALARFRDAIRSRTRRRSGQRQRKAKHCTLRRLQRSQSLREMLEKVSAYLRGWLGYFGGVETSYDRYFTKFDEFVRRRLRSHIAGRWAKGRWHQILRNALFRDLGLFDLVAHGPSPSPHCLSRP